MACKAIALPLSYIPSKMVGRGGFEPPTSRLSAACSNQLSYRPIKNTAHKYRQRQKHKTYICRILSNRHCLLRKEVIQPHLPVRLPCYDFTPLTRHTFDGSSPKVRPPASGTPGSGGVTGGVYKARERIHRSLADLRLLAIPAS